MFVRTKHCPAKQEKGYCVTAYNEDQNEGVIKVNDVPETIRDATTDDMNQCLRACRALKEDASKSKHYNLHVTGCEMIWGQWNRGCYAHTNDVAKGTNVDRHMCWVLSKCIEG